MENIENLKVLQSMAKDFTILFVEDSKALQKQVVLFLGKFFKEVYVEIGRASCRERVCLYV